MKKKITIFFSFFFPFFLKNLGCSINGDNGDNDADDVDDDNAKGSHSDRDEIKSGYEQGRIHSIIRSPSSFLPAEKKHFRQTDGQMDRRTDGQRPI